MSIRFHFNFNTSFCLSVSYNNLSSNFNDALTTTGNYFEYFSDLAKSVIAQTNLDDVTVESLKIHQSSGIRNNNEKLLI